MTSNTDQIDSIQKSVQTLTFLVIVLILAVGILFVKDYTSPAKTGTQVATTETITPTPVITRDQVQALFNKKYLAFGDKNSKNLIVEFSDPSCPYCHFAGGQNPELSREAGAQFQLDTDGGTYTAPVPQIEALLAKKKIGFVWVFQNGHGNGEMGTKAFYCARDQGKFWEVHNLLMSNAGYTLLNETVKNDKAQSAVLADFLSGVADYDQMEACLSSGKYDQVISQNMQTASSFGAKGTPNFLINTRLFEGAYSWKDMQSALN